MTITLVWSTLAATLAVALAVVAWVLALLRRGQTVDAAGHASLASSQPLPVALRFVCRIAQPLAALLTGRLPRRLQVAVTRQLAHAGLLGAVDAATWTASLLTWAGSGLGAMCLAACWIGGFAWSWLLVPILLVWTSQAWLQARAARRASILVKELPAAIDLLVLCLESGASLVTAVRLTHEKSSSGPLQDLFSSTLQQIRTGKGRASAFRQVMEQFDLPAVSGVMTALIQADARGMSLGPVLRAQSQQCVAERFVRAERAAMQAPVKLLMPLLLCIFPCTFIVIAVPIAARLANGGAP